MVTAITVQPLVGLRFGAKHQLRVNADVTANAALVSVLDAELLGGLLQRVRDQERDLDVAGLGERIANRSV